jgi:transposase
MPSRRYAVELTSQERKSTKRLITIGKAAAYEQRHARISLLANEASGRERLPDEQIARAVSCGVATVERLRKRFVEEGLDAAPERHKS